MSFGLEPSNFLGMLEEAVKEFRKDDLSLRKAITASIFANHLPEHVFAKYGKGDPKVRGAVTVSAYRLSVIDSEPALGIIRDLCDYGKHAKITQRPFEVDHTTKQTQLVPQYSGFLLALTNHVPGEKLVVTLKDGRSGWMDGYLSRALNFWKAEFSARSL